MRWLVFATRQEQRRASAQVAASALRAGDPGPAGLMLQTWRFAEESALCEPFLRQLLHAPLAPDAAALGSWWGDLRGLSPELDRPERAWLRDQATRRPPGDAPDPLAWALAALAWWGEEVQDLERDSWAERTFAADPARDSRAAALWAAWFVGDLGRVWKGWEPGYWPAARRGLRAALVARRVPDAEQQRVREDTREAFLSLFLGSPGSAPGWRELAVRVVEGGHPGGPVAALAGLVEPVHWPAFFRCLARRQPWRGTAVRLNPSRSEEGPFGQAWTAAEPGRLEALLDLHTAHRLVRSWRSPHCCGIEASWRVLRHHRHRVRGRLRALVRDQGGERLREALFSLDNLHSRTEAAVGSYLWTWAQSELKTRFAVVPRVLTPPCVQPAPRAERRGRVDSPEILAIERCWTGLVYLRGKRELLHLFVLQRFKTNGSLGELMALLPAAVADPDTARNRTWRALRRSLRQRLPGYEADLRPMFTQLAALDPQHRALKPQALAILRPCWHEALPLPRGGFPNLVRVARTLVGAP